MNTQEMMERLAAPFAAHEVKWKPQSIKGNRAMIVAYIDSRVVAERLDEVFGIDGWEEQTEVLPDGSALCRLSVWIGERKVTRSDVGSPSDQPDAGDRLKSAFSDALKRAAVKLGVGRYLYSMPKAWVDYDPMKKQIAGVLPKVPSGFSTNYRAKFAAAKSLEELKGHYTSTFSDMVRAKDEAKARLASEIDSPK